jgi:hypothetical protein
MSDSYVYQNTVLEFGNIPLKMGVQFQRPIVKMIYLNSKKMRVTEIKVQRRVIN